MADAAAALNDYLWSTHTHTERERQELQTTKIKWKKINHWYTLQIKYIDTHADAHAQAYYYYCYYYSSVDSVYIIFSRSVAFSSSQESIAVAERERERNSNLTAVNSCKICILCWAIVKSICIGI